MSLVQVRSAAGGRICGFRSPAEGVEVRPVVSTPVMRPRRYGPLFLPASTSVELLSLQSRFSRSLRRPNGNTTLSDRKIMDGTRDSDLSCGRMFLPPKQSGAARIRCNEEGAPSSTEGANCYETTDILNQRMRRRAADPGSRFESAAACDFGTQRNAWFKSNGYVRQCSSASHQVHSYSSKSRAELETKMPPHHGSGIVGALQRLWS